MDLDALIRSLLKCRDCPDALADGEPQQIAGDAIEEIKRLRASQFRWRSVKEKRPTEADANATGQLLCYHSTDRNWPYSTVDWSAAGWDSGDITHWAPIPPLPEKSREPKDEELWEKYFEMHQFDTGNNEWKLRQYFLAGLKAAREQKP